MIASHHMASTISELDLRTCRPSPVADRINAVPGLKTSTAFFTFLRANLVLTPSAMSSNVSTPLLEPSSSQSPSPSRLPQPYASASAASASATAALDDIPSLSLDILTDRDDKAEALRLVADSIAQQRQQASLHLIFHPLNLAALAAALALAYQLLRPRSPDPAAAFVPLAGGLVLAYLLTVRWATAGYLRAAEALAWPWLAAGHAAGTHDDTVIATRWGRDLIGALVLRLEPAPPGSSSGPSGGRRRHRGGGGGSSGSHNHLRGGRGVIRAWTTKLPYRGRGVGADMLHEAVRLTRERCGREAEVGFAREHANSEMVLPELYNGPFRKREMRAAKALERVVGGWEGTKRKR